MDGPTFGREGGAAPTVSALGALREEFGRSATVRPNSSRSATVRRQYGLFAAVGFIIGLLCLWLGAWLPGAVFLALGVLMTWGLLRQRDVRVRVYERGFEFTRRGRTQEFAWDEVEVFQESQQVFRHQLSGLQSGVGYRYFVRARDGRSLTMDNEVAGTRELGERLREETLKRLLPRAEELVGRGEAASFGQLAVTSAGVARGESLLPWAEVGRVDVSEGKLVVVGRDGRQWSEDLYGFVSNAHVLLALAQRMKQKHF